MKALDAGPVNAAGVSGGTLGEIIAAHRRRHRQPRRDVPWSQEELAFASGTDQAHISRIESNRQHPEYATLVRICDALDLSQTERAHILTLAGYQVVAPLPSEVTVASVLAKLVPVLDSYPYPVVLLDEGERQWYLNQIVATLWGQCYGATDQRGCLARIRGRRTVELIFDPAAYGECLSRWEAYYEDIEQVLMRNIALFWRAYCLRLNDPDLNRIVSGLKDNPDFLRRWKRIETGDIGLTFIDHASYVTRHPEFGRLHWHAWRTRAAVDERFIVCHFSPVDGATSRVLEGLVQAESRDRHAQGENGENMPARHCETQLRALS